MMLIPDASEIFLTLKEQKTIMNNYYLHRINLNNPAEDDFNVAPDYQSLSDDVMIDIVPTIGNVMKDYDNDNNISAIINYPATTLLNIWHSWNAEKVLNIITDTLLMVNTDKVIMPQLFAGNIEPIIRVASNMVSTILHEYVEKPRSIVEDYINYSSKPCNDLLWVFLTEEEFMCIVGDEEL